MTEFTCKRCGQVFQSPEALKSHIIDRVSCLEYAVTYLYEQNKRLLNVLTRYYSLLDDKFADVDKRMDKEVRDIGLRIDDLE